MLWPEKWCGVNGSGPNDRFCSFMVKGNRNNISLCDSIAISHVDRVRSLLVVNNSLCKLWAEGSHHLIDCRTPECIHCQVINVCRPTCQLQVRQNNEDLPGIWAARPAFFRNNCASADCSGWLFGLRKIDSSSISSLHLIWSSSLPSNSASVEYFWNAPQQIPRDTKSRPTSNSRRPSCLIEVKVYVSLGMVMRLAKIIVSRTAGLRGGVVCVPSFPSGHCQATSNNPFSFVLINSQFC